MFKHGLINQMPRVGYDGDGDGETILVRAENGFVRGISKTDRTVSFRLSDNSLDRQNSRIDPHGIDTTNYSRNPVFLWGHDGYGSMAGAPNPENVIGRSISWGVTDLSRGEGATAAFDIRAEFTPKSINPRGELAFNLVKNGFLNAVSIGVRILEWVNEKSAKRGKPDVIVYSQSDMLEASLVPIPANPNAVALARSLVKDYESLDLFPSDVAERLTRWAQTQSATPPDESAEPGNVDATAILAQTAIRHFRKADEVDAFEAACKGALERMRG